MKKIIYFLLLSSFISLGQTDTLSYGFTKKLQIESSNFIKLFKFEIGHGCNQSKDVKLIFKNEISPCFVFVKNIDKKTTKNIVKLLNQKTSYGGGYDACFDTNYALLIYDKNGCITSSIQISLSCNRLHTKSIIDVLIPLYEMDFRPVGFSPLARAEISNNSLARCLWLVPTKYGNQKQKTPASPSIR